MCIRCSTRMALMETFRSHTSSNSLSSTLRICFLLFALTSVFASLPHEQSEDGRPYCDWQSFNASCASDEVVVMNFARYGRMRKGSCLSSAYQGDTCSRDVTSKFDKECSGKKSCLISVISLHAEWHCGSSDYKSFLEASFDCHRAANALTWTGNDSLVQLLPVSEFGIIASIFAFVKTGESEPHTIEIRVRPHQLINLTLVDFSVGRGDENSGGHGTAGDCKQYGQATEVLENGTVITMKICGGNVREKTVYVSRTDARRIRLNSTTLRQSNFILKYQAVGCPPLVVPPDAWVSRSTPQTASVQCNKTEEAWHLTCHGVQWVGKIGNCSSTANRPAGSDDWSFDDVFSSTSHFPLGVLIVICVGVAIGVAFGVLLLVVVIVYMRRRRQRKMKTHFSTCTLNNKSKFSSQSFSSLAFQQMTPVSVTGTINKGTWVRNRALPDPLAATGTYFRNGTSSAGSISTPITPFDLTLLSPTRQGADVTSCTGTLCCSSNYGTRGRAGDQMNHPKSLNEDGGLTTSQSESCIIADPARTDTNPYYFKLESAITGRDEEWHSPAPVVANCAVCVAYATLNRHRQPQCVH